MSSTKRRRRPDAISRSSGSPLDPSYMPVSPQMHAVTVALSGSCACESSEMRSFVAGQIARAISVFRVSRVIVFADDCSKGDFQEGHLFLARILQYLECPPYLRALVFPEHEDLKHVASLPPLELPHHITKSDRIRWREGVIVDREGRVTQGDKKNNHVNVGLNHQVRVDRHL